MAAAKLAGRQRIWQRLGLLKQAGSDNLARGIMAHEPTERRSIAIEFRQAGRDDASAIAVIHDLAHRETYIPMLGHAHYWPSDPAERLAQWTSALTGPGLAYIAAEAGQIVGFVHAEGHRITTLYILASYHRRGIGRRLLFLIRRALAQCGIPAVRFAVLAINTKAIAFYEAEGARYTETIAVHESGFSNEDRLYEISTRVA
jgi:ribosomal protein S18 acetylase RimI-like enzyme